MNGKITDEEKLGMRRRATSCVTNKTRNGEGGTWERNRTCLESRKSLNSKVSFGSTCLLRDQAYEIIRYFQTGIRHRAKDAFFVIRLEHLAHHPKVGGEVFQTPSNSFQNDRDPI